MELIFSTIRRSDTKRKALLVFWYVSVMLSLSTYNSFAQGDARANAQLDARQIVIGDQARFFIHIQNNPATGRVQWAVIPDSFNNLEVVERGKIDTIKQGNLVTYNQRIVITGFDSGIFKIPAFTFPVIPNSGDPYTIQTDSFALMVQTVAVDTTKGFKGIKGIIYVKSSWLDYIWLIAGGVLFFLLLAFVIIYFIRNKKLATKAQGATESLQDYALRLLRELELRQLWQKKQVKEYYVELTDIVRNYIEARFQTSAMELTTDEMLAKSLEIREMQPYHDLLMSILQTADLAKFAKFQPLAEVHVQTMEQARQFIDSSRPVIVENPVANNTDSNKPETKTDNTNPS